MELQKQYHEDLLAWCQSAELSWDVLKPTFSKLFDLRSLEEWEESCRQLKAKLQDETNVTIEDYGTAKSLYGQLELLYREARVHQEEVELITEEDEYQEEAEEDSDMRLEAEVEVQMDASELEVIPDDEEIQLEQSANSEELMQYRNDLLEWCNNIYLNWNRRKTTFSKTAELESLEEWEGLCCQLIDKLQENQTVDFEDYETANNLFEQWERLVKESDVSQVE